MDAVDKVATVIDDEVRSDFDYAGQMAIVFFGGCIVPGKDVQTVVNQCCRHVILGRQGIATRHIHFRTPGRQNLAQIRSFCFQVYRQGNFQTLERQFTTEIFFDATQDVHVTDYPIDLHFSTFPQFGISNFTHVISFFTLFYMTKRHTWRTYYAKL